MAASPTPSWRSAWACRPRRAGAACGRWRRPASSRATTPRSTATRSGWACSPSCASTPNACSGEATRKLEDAIRKLPEVVSCHYISGTGTFELQVVAQDLDSFSRFARAAPDEPAQREGPAHQLLAGRGEGEQCVAARRTWRRPRQTRRRAVEDNRGPMPPISHRGNPRHATRRRAARRRARAAQAPRVPHAVEHLAHRQHLHVDERRGGGVDDDLADHLADLGGAGAVGLDPAGVPARACRAARWPTSSTAGAGWSPRSSGWPARRSCCAPPWRWT